MKIVIGLIISLITSPLFYPNSFDQNKSENIYESKLIVRFSQGKTIMDMEYDSNKDIYLLTREADTSVIVSPFSSYRPTIYQLIKIIKSTNEIIVIDSNFPKTNQILFDRKDNIWAVNNNTLYFRGGDKIKTIISDVNFSFISVDNENNIWAGSLSAHSIGLYKIDNDLNVEILNTENSGLRTNSISGIYIDYYNNLWLALGDNFGVLKISNDDWQYFNSDNSRIPPSLIIESIVSDYQDNIWIAGHNDKEMYVMKFDGKKWIKENKYDGNKDFVSIDNIYSCNKKMIAILSETDRFLTRLRSSKVLLFDGKSWKNDINPTNGRSIWGILTNSETKSLILNTAVGLYELKVK